MGEGRRGEGRIGDKAKREGENGRDWSCNMLVVQQEKESPWVPLLKEKGDSKRGEK